MLDAREELPRSDRAAFFDWVERLVAAEAMGLAEPLLADLTSSAARAEPISVASELEWIAYRLRPFVGRLTAFHQRRSQLVDAFWADDWEACKSEISYIAEEFGPSLWLIEAEIALRQHFDGLESQKEALTKVRRDYPGGIPAFLAFYVSIRNEQRSSYNLFNEDFEDRIAKSKLPTRLQEYLKYKVLKIFRYTDTTLSSLLMYEQGQSIFDIYEVTIDLLQRAISQAGTIKWRTSAVALLELLRPIGDWRVEKLSFSLTGEAQRCSAFEPVPLLASDVAFKELVRSDVWRGFWRLLQDDSEVANEDKNAAQIADRIAALVRSLLRRDDDFEESRGRLLKFARNFPFLPSAIALGELTEFVTFHATAASPSLGAVAINSSKFTAADLLHVLEVARDAARNSLSEFIGPDVVRVWLGEEPIAYGSDVQPFAWYLASLRRAVSDSGHALEVVSEIPTATLTPAQRVLVTNLRIQLLLTQGERDEAIRYIADEVADAPSIVMVVPAIDAVGERDWDSLTRVASKLDLAIALYAYWRQTEESLYATYLRFTFEEVLFEARVNLPSEFSVDKALNKQKATFFLANICIPVLMDTSGLFTSSDELLDERLNVLALLARENRRAESVYAEEAAGIRTNKLIRSGLQIIDSNRVNVDIAALTRWAMRRYQESYLRYQALVEADVGTAAKFEEVLAVIRSSAESKGEYFTIPDSEADTLLLEIILDIKRKFLEDPEYGLEYFLGKRIRHGTIAGHMRGPVETSGLITERANPSAPYQENIEWLPQLSFADAGARESASACFDKFSEDYDKLISYARDQRLHVRSTSHPEGLFDVAIGPPQYHLMKSIATRDLDFEGFVGFAINIMWVQLQPSLEAAKAFLAIEMKGAVDQLFGTLQACLREQIEADDAARHLMTAIQSTNTEVQRQLDTVSSWFERFESKQASHLFTLAEVIEIAVQSALKTLTGFKPTIVPDVQGEVNATAPVIIALTDFIFVVLDNVYRRARVGNEPEIEIFSSVTEPNFLRVAIRNPIGDSVDVSELKRSLEIVKSKIAAGDIVTGAAADRGSGLLKVAAFVRHFPKARFRFEVIDDCQFQTELWLPVIVLDDRLSLPLPEVP